MAILEVASLKIDRFGWSQMDKHIKDQVCNEWCDVLSQYTLAEVRAGVAAVFYASGGKLKSINEYQVQDKILEAHRLAVSSLPKQEPEPERENLTAEERKAIAARVLSQAGVGARGFPKEQSEAQTQANINAAKAQIERGASE